MPPPTSANPLNPTIAVSSPAAGDILSQSFTASGTFDLDSGTFQKVECQLMDAGTSNPAENAITGSIDPARGIWTVNMTTALTGVYDLAARIHLTTGEYGEAIIAGIQIEANPNVGLILPVPGDDPGTTSVGVQLTFKPGHRITQIDVELQDAAGNWESKTSSIISRNQVGWGPLSMSGFAGEDHRVRVVAKNSGGADFTLSAGAIRLS